VVGPGQNHEGRPARGAPDELRRSWTDQLPKSNSLPFTSSERSSALRSSPAEKPVVMKIPLMTSLPWSVTTWLNGVRQQNSWRVSPPGR
jgi:hypothetical protein